MFTKFGSARTDGQSDNIMRPARNDGGGRDVKKARGVNAKAENAKVILSSKCQS